MHVLESDEITDLLQQEMYDGTGNTVHIPTIIISKYDGEAIMNQIYEQPNGILQLKADFEVSKQHETGVTYELFYGSVADLPLKLILDLYEYQHALMQYATFIPRIKTFQCKPSNCSPDIIESQCLSNGQYCFSKPNEDMAMLYPNLNERQSLRENVR